jgi:hypothetical protein
VRKRKLPFARRFKVDLSQLKEKQNQRLDYMEGKAAPWEVALSIYSDDKETAWLFAELQLDASNPLHWRALLEAFTQTHVRHLRDKQFPSFHQRRQLAWDLFDIKVAPPDIQIHTSCKGPLLPGKWSSLKCAAFLKKNALYKKRYAGIGVDALRKQIDNIVAEVGSPDKHLASLMQLRMPDDMMEDVPPETLGRRLPHKTRPRTMFKIEPLVSRPRKPT